MKRVFLQFSFRQGWFCEFMEEDQKTRLPRTVTLADERKLFELVKLGGFTLTISGRQEIRKSNQEETRRRLAGTHGGAIRKAAATLVNFLNGECVKCKCQSKHVVDRLNPEPA